MGRPSPPTFSARVASTMVPTLTAFFTFVLPPTLQLNSMLDVLMKDVMEIVGLARASRHRELLEFGEFVEKMVDQLISVLRNKQLAQHPNVMSNLEHLHKTLHRISCQISYLDGSGGLASRFRHMLFPEEDHLPRMRQRLDDALKVFEFGATIELLANCPGPLTDRTAPCTSKLDPLQAQDLSRLPVHERPHAHGHQALGKIEPDKLGSSHPRTDTRLCAQGTDPPHTFTASPDNSTPTDAEISIAFMNVERLRRSLHHTRSPTLMMQLAEALSRLTNLLAKAGRTREALEISQESARLYKSLAERP